MFLEVQYSNPVGALTTSSKEQAPKSRIYRQTVGFVSARAVLLRHNIPSTTAYQANTPSSHSCPSRKIKRQYVSLLMVMTIKSCLAQASPEAAPVSWLVINALCLVCSLYLAIYNFWIIHREGTAASWKRQQATDDDDDGDDKFMKDQVVQATVEYLVWSLVTTIVWMLEVALRATFPSGSEGIHPTDDKEIMVVGSVPNEGTDDAYRIQPDENDHDDENTEKMIHQQKVQTRVLFAELILALFFLVESILDCLHWKARVKEDDFVQQELDIWINIAAYIYMTYETYKTASTKGHWRRSCCCCPGSSKAISILPLKDTLIQDEHCPVQTSCQVSASNVSKVIV